MSLLTICHFQPQLHFWDQVVPPTRLRHDLIADEGASVGRVHVSEYRGIAVLWLRKRMKVVQDEELVVRNMTKLITDDLVTDPACPEDFQGP